VVANAVSADEASATAPDPDVEEVLVLKAARAREEAMRIADAGDHEAARRLLHATAAALDEVPSELAHAHADEIRAAEHRLTPELYDAATRKQMWFQKHQAQRRRER